MYTKEDLQEWEEILPRISASEHDRRVTELLNAHNLTLERARRAEARVRDLEGALAGAIEIIKEAPSDTWGINGEGDFAESHLCRWWPIQDEHVHYLGLALKGETDG